MIDHLWQSTLCTGAAALLALALRHKPAHVRYAVWLAASLKFLVPFTALMAVGRQFAWRTTIADAPAAEAAPLAAFDAIAQPFATAAMTGASVTADAMTFGIAAAAPWIVGVACATGTIAVALSWLLRWRRIARAVTGARTIERGREVEVLRRLERQAGTRRAVELRVSDGMLEPGIFGIRRPVLLWPAGISSRLTDSQVEAILAHEIAHVRRHDNVTAGLHMVVQALFWFHPLVWWLGQRLVDERERACDQDVLRTGAAPDDYAEGILRTVRACVESPLVCVAGVTGSDLKRRIEDIMQHRSGSPLRLWQKAVLAGTVLGVLAVPVVRGALTVTVVAQQAAPAQPAPAFETASVKRNNTAEGRVSMRIMPGGAYEALNVTVRAMIQQANGLQEFQVIGGPDWLATQRIDILAKAPQGEELLLMPRLWTLLQDRFKLKTRRETRDTAIYALVLARADKQLGPSIKANPVECAPAAGRPGGPPPGPGAPPPGRGAAAGAAGRGPVPMDMSPMEMGPLGARPCSQMNNGGKVMAGGQTLAQIAQTLQRQTGRIVQDRTGLTGRFDYDLQFTPDPQLAGRGPGGGLPPNIENPRPVDPNAISIFSAVQEQLGLRLESARGAVDVLVIESAEPLVEN